MKIRKAAAAATLLLALTCGLGFAQSYQQSRQKLSAPVTYFVLTTGNDSACTGLTNAAYVSGSFPQNCGFLTPQKAWNVITQTLDLACNVATIKIADGTYTTGIQSTDGAVGGCGPNAITITGDTATPANVLFNTSLAAAGVFEFGSGTFAGPGVGVTISGMELRNSGSGGNGISAWGAGTVISYDNIRFGAISNAQIASQHGALVFDLHGAYFITGSATYHFLILTGGQVYEDSTSVTCSNTPAFTDFALVSDLGNLMAGGMTFPSCGSVIGSRFLLTRNGNIFTGGSGASFFPGNTAGSIVGQASYDGQNYLPLDALTFATLPTATAGIFAYISDGKASNCGDAACTTWGTTVTGGTGALKLLLWYNGANWTLAGK